MKRNELCFVRYADSRDSHYDSRVADGICQLREVVADGRSIFVFTGIYQCDSGL